MTKPLLEISNMEVCYFGKPVVRDLSLKIEPGEILGIVGESGSGKSTVIRAAIRTFEKGRNRYKRGDFLQRTEHNPGRRRGTAKDPGTGNGNGLPKRRGFPLPCAYH